MATKTRASLGTVKGQPIRFVPGHGNFQKTGKPYKAERYRVEDRGYVTPCWIWVLALGPKGYGSEWDGSRGRMVTPHILAYERTHGRVPLGMEIDHLCSQRACVNPAHLEAVTHAENIRRGAERGSYHGASFNARKTHCPHGHPYTEENTYLHNGARKCRTCVLERAREYRERRRST